MYVLWPAMLMQAAHLTRFQCIPMTGGMTNNFFHAPSVYNGRVSSIIPSPQSVRRPKGVMYDTGKNDGNPVYGPSKKLDFELEMGYFVSRPIDFGETMNADDAQEHIFGFVLLNDWSARDIQSFELKPLGPFHSKGMRIACKRTSNELKTDQDLEHPSHRGLLHWMLLNHSHVSRSMTTRQRTLSI